MNLPRSYKAKKHNKKAYGYPVRKKLRHRRVYMLFLYIKICHGVIRLFCGRKALPKLLLTMPANVVYYT